MSRKAARVKQTIAFFLPRLQRLFDRPSARFIVYGVIGIWVIAGDPLGMSSATDRAVSEEYADVYSRTSPVAMPPLTVVTIDSRSIEELSGGGRMESLDWPITYVEHAAIITQIAKGKSHPPVAIFYDILFEKPRHTSGELERLNSRVAVISDRAEIPIFFAGGGPDMPLSEASIDILTAPRFVRTNWHEKIGTYPLSFNHDPWFESQKEQFGTGMSIDRFTPAMALYQAYCVASNDCADADFSGSDFQNNLQIHWPMKSQTDDDSGGAPCLSNGTIRRHLDVLWRVVLATVKALFNSEGVGPAPVKCFPINTIQVSDLFSDNNPLALAPPGLATGEPYVVMVGVVIPSVGDYHPTPVYEKLPGVFFHAAAFENLYRMGGDYYHHKDLTLFSVVVWFMGSLAMMAHARFRESHPVASPILVFLGWSFVLAFSVLVMQIFFTKVFRIVPEGWLSMVAILPLLREVVMRREAAIFKNGE